MSAQQTNRISGRFLIVFSLIAFLAVLSGYFQPVQADEGTAAHIFQLAIVAAAATVLIFLVTADWSQPRRSARPLILPAASLIVTFAMLYYLEHYR
jgi:uncharacterized membrane protein YozB (DUF420 family)